MGNLIQEVWAASGVVGLIITGLVFALGIYFKKISSKNTDKTNNVLSDGFTTLAGDMAKNNTELINALIEQNKNNTVAFLDIVKTTLKQHDIDTDKEYDDKLTLRKDVSYIIKQKIHDLLNRYNADRAFILEFHNNKQNLTGLPFLWFDMTFEEIAKGINTIQAAWKDQEASQLLPVVKDINDNDGFKIYSLEDLEELQHTSSVLYRRLRVDRQLQEAIMVGLYDNNNKIIGIFILEYEDSFIPVEVLDPEDIIAVSASISVLLDCSSVSNEYTKK